MLIGAVKASARAERFDGNFALVIQNVSILVKRGYQKIPNPKAFAGSNSRRR
jgi:hypothetical protein